MALVAGAMRFVIKPVITFLILVPPIPIVAPGQRAKETRAFKPALACMGIVRMAKPAAVVPSVIAMGNAAKYAAD